MSAHEFSAGPRAAGSFLSELWKKSGKDVGFCDVSTEAPGSYNDWQGTMDMPDNCSVVAECSEVADDMEYEVDVTARRLDSAPMRYCPEFGHDWRNRSPYSRSLARRGRSRHRD